MQVSKKSVSEKLGVKEGKKVLVLNSPKGYKEMAGSARIEEADVIQVFVSSKEEVLEFIEKNRSRLKKTVALWMTYPKASPKLGINRDILNQMLISYKMEACSICAIDDVWSALRFKVV